MPQKDVKIGAVKYNGPYMRILVYKSFDEKIFDKLYDIRQATPRDVLDDIVSSTRYNPGIREVIRAVSDPTISNRARPEY